MATHHKASIVAVMGQSGQGKGLWIKARLRAAPPSRLLVWDPMDEHGTLARAQQSLAHMVHAVLKRAGARAPFAVRYTPKGNAERQTAAEFAVFCRLAQEAGNCTVVVEELSFVTRPSHAPAPWAKLTNAGRHAGNRIIASSQFPAQIDKAFLSNATEIVSFYLGEKPHREVVAEKMDTDPERIRALPTFHYLHFDRDSRQVSAGQVAPPASGPAPAGAPVVLPGASGNASGEASATQGPSGPALFGL